MDSWYRIAFTQDQTLRFSEAWRTIEDSLRSTQWQSDVGVFVTKDWVTQGGDQPLLFIYFSPAAAQVFDSAIEQFGGEACLRPLPIGLSAHGHFAAKELLCE